MNEFPHSGAAPQSDWSTTPCTAPHHHVDPMPMRPYRHQFADTIGHDEMMAAHYIPPRAAARESWEPHNSGPPAESRVRGVNGQDFHIVRRPDPYGRYYVPGYYYGGYPAPYGAGGYGGPVSAPMPGPVQAPGRPMSQLYATFVGLLGVAGVIGGGAIGLGGLLHHSVGLLVFGGLVGVGGFSLYKNATKVTDPE